jgi:hypothetical protein
MYPTWKLGTVGDFFLDLSRNQEGTVLPRPDMS